MSKIGRSKKIFTVVFQDVPVWYIEMSPWWDVSSSTLWFATNRCINGPIALSKISGKKPNQTQTKTILYICFAYVSLNLILAHVIFKILMYITNICLFYPETLWPDLGWIYQYIDVLNRCARRQVLYLDAAKT